MRTADKIAENIEAVKKLFPHVITEKINKAGLVEYAIDFDALKQELSQEFVEGPEERYQFTWPDKRKTMRLAASPVTATLRPCREESVNFDSTENLYIEGDNLDVLKLLRETYLNKIKMIYIDPPYNTGNDFVYDDDFSESAEEYAERSGDYDDQGNRLFQNTDSNGRFHTDWLNMIYPRLKVAKDLLAEDGAIFISIDDHEQENLKKICDEIFGEKNFVNHFTWVVNLTGRQISGKGAAKTWESIILYAKDINCFRPLLIDVKSAKQFMPDAYKGLIKDIREDSHGFFAVGDTLYNHNRKFNEETRKNLVFSIFYNPEKEDFIAGDSGKNIKGYVEISPHSNGDGIHKYHAWRWSKEKIKNESYNLLALQNSNGGYEIYTKQRGFNQTTLKDIITNVSNGDAELQQLFDGKRFFEYPKSTALLKILCGSNFNQDSLILDFFSGSATTAHAVMQLNAEDGGHRKFIMVQLPEPCKEKSEAFKAGYKDICQIGKERIRRAAKKIKEVSPLTALNLDTGFRVLKLDSSNMKDVYYTSAETPQQIIPELIDNIKDDRTEEDLLFQVMLDLGIEPSSKIEKTKIAGKKIFCVADNFLIACFEKNLTDKMITEIAQRKPDYAVFRDSAFANDSVVANCEQIFKNCSSITVKRIL